MIGSVIACIRLSTKRPASITRMSRSWKRRGVGSTSTASRSALVAAPSSLAAAQRRASRSRQSAATSAASSEGPTDCASGRSANARPSHLLYGAHRRSMRKARRSRDRWRWRRRTPAPPSHRRAVRPRAECRRTQGRRGARRSHERGRSRTWWPPLAPAGATTVRVGPMSRLDILTRSRRAPPAYGGT